MRIQSCWKGKPFAGVLLLALLGTAARHAPAQPQAQPSPSTADLRKQFLLKLSDAAIERTRHTVRYDGAYVRIPYPGGDVPAATGVCTDEVIRSYRALGIDLQKEVHEDIAAHFAAYPNQRLWGRTSPDSNIDHRRVSNLMVFFSRKGEALPVTDRAGDYAPGDLITWDLGRGLTHIGIVVDRKGLLSRRYMIVHNIGAGPRMEDVLFDWKITGHYRYFGPGGQVFTAKDAKDAKELVTGKQQMPPQSAQRAQREKSLSIKAQTI